MQIDGFIDELNYLASQIHHSPNLKMPTTWAQSRIKIKLFTSKKEWVLSKDIAKQLQLYIGEFQS